MMEEIILFKDKKDCCGCGACVNVCSKKAITMQPDEYGFLYPQIDPEACVKCGACKKVCAYQDESKNGSKPMLAFVAANRNKEQIMNSASGGVFSAVATKFLIEGGVVFGATLTFENGHANPHHISIEVMEDLPKLQGSKYVQSSIGECYKEAQTFLKQGRKVLFSGTPCQVAGLYGFLRKDYDNLTTIDLICHGVPNAEFFDGYIQVEKVKRKVKEIMGYAFRDKKKGWGMNGRIDMKNKKEKVCSVYVPARLNSYNTLFLDGYTYRENCYSCRYARQNRISDLTIGDYWGIEVEHPELLGVGGYDEKAGISCVLVNTEKGKNLCASMEELLRLDISEFEKVQRRNGQLIAPSKKANGREQILEIYKNNKYPGVEMFFQKRFKKQIVIHKIYNAVPRSFRLKLKKILKG